MEDDDPAEEGGDLEPSLGMPEGVNQSRGYDFSPGDDLELDPAESGFGDEDGLREQTVGEPSLGATLDIDQRVAWGADRLNGLLDGKATGNENDVQVYLPWEAREANRAAADKARADARAILRRRGASAGVPV